VEPSSKSSFPFETHKSCLSTTLLEFRSQKIGCIVIYSPALTFINRMEVENGFPLVNNQNRESSSESSFTGTETLKDHHHHTTLSPALDFCQPLDK